MTETQALQRCLERALALAHAAVDDPTIRRIADARAAGASALSLAHQSRPPALSLEQGHDLVARVNQLRAVLRLVDEPRSSPSSSL